MMVSPDGVVPSRMVGVSASVNLPLHHKVQKFSSGTSLPENQNLAASYRPISLLSVCYKLLERLTLHRISPDV